MNLHQFKIILMGEGSKILDNKFKEKISFPYEIDLLEESEEDICEAGLKLSSRIKQTRGCNNSKKTDKTRFF